MTNETRTPAQPAVKRTRFSDEVANITTTTTIAPSKAAKTTVEAAVASYPEAIQTIALDASKTYNGLKATIRMQEHTILRFDDEDEVPGSAKLKFKLHAAPEIMEMDEFKIQESAMAEAVKTFQVAAKKAIVTIATLRLDYEKSQVKSAFMNSLLRLCEMLLIENAPDRTTQPVTRFAWYAADKGEALLFRQCNTTRLATCNELKRNLDDDEGTDNNSPVIWKLGELPLFAQLLLRLNPLLNSIYIDSWNAQLEIYKEAEIKKRLALKAKELLTERKAEEIQMEIDDEAAVPAKKIKELIQEAVKKESKKNETEISKLRATIQRSAKNYSRGAESSSPSASSKKKQKGKEKEKDSKKQKRDRSPAPKGKDSQKGKPNSKKQSGKKGTKQNSGQSQTRRKQRSNPSTTE
jgi:hypothetical protein